MQSLLLPEHANILGCNTVTHLFELAESGHDWRCGITHIYCAIVWVPHWSHSVSCCFATLPPQVARSIWLEVSRRSTALSVYILTALFFSVKVSGKQKGDRSDCVCHQGYLCALCLPVFDVASTPISTPLTPKFTLLTNKYCTSTWIWKN